MKKALFISLAAFILASCASSRKTAKDVQEHAVDSVETHVSITESSTKAVDTTRTTDGEIIITEIVFDNKPDSSGGNPDAGAELDLPGIGKVKGSVKSVKQTKVKQKEERRGESQETRTAKDETSNANVARRDREEHKAATPVPDPYRWRYIAFIIGVLMVAALLLYLKRQPILRAIRNFASMIRRFLE